MFEFSIARRYLIPRRKHLSLSLIALMSVWVISTVVWLLLLFLSVTEGIEKNWLTRLTSLNAPIKIVPTEAYYQSYYYQVDGISADSDYTYKSIRDKLQTEQTDPYQVSMDEELPFFWPERILNKDGTPNDLVKNAFASIEQSKQSHHPTLSYQDYEMTGALMRLRLVRPMYDPLSYGVDTQSFLTQVSYFSSFPEFSKDLHGLIQKPCAKDINHLLYLSSLSDENESSDLPQVPKKHSETRLSEDHKAILSHCDIQEMTTHPTKWTVPHQLVRDNFKAYGKLQNGEMGYIILASDHSQKDLPESMDKGTLCRKGGTLYFTTDEYSTPLSTQCPLYLESSQTLATRLDPTSVRDATHFSDLLLSAKFTLQGCQLTGIIPFNHVEISKAAIQDTFSEEPSSKPPWPYYVGNRCFLPQGGVILPHNFRDNHVLLGDKGYLAYGASTPTMIQEMRSPIWVCGFYDPGVMSVGARFILADHDTIRDINIATQNLAIDPSLASGIQVWTDNLNEVPQIVSELKTSFAEKGISEYWKVIPFYEYDFAKDLLQQFKSDRYLFMMVGVIILIVACSNVITLLLLLVNDKKREIGIFLSLGARKRSIAAIFGICGGVMGLVSSVIGCIVAVITLHNIDSLTALLSFIEGQEAFNVAFYGDSLPNTLSSSALYFILFLTPIISCLAGLIPAIKACKLKPSTILRSE